MFGTVRGAQDLEYIPYFIHEHWSAECWTHNGNKRKAILLRTKSEINIPFRFEITFIPQFCFWIFLSQYEYNTTCRQYVKKNKLS